MKKLVWTVTLMLLTVFFFSCEKEKIETEIEVVENAALAEELRKTPESLTLDGQTYSLKADLLRNLMPSPGTSNSGSRLTSTIYFYERDSLAILTKVVLLRQYVLKGNEIWKASYDEIKKPQEYIVEGISRRGPFWEVDTEIDVVCEFSLSSNGCTYRLLTRNQKISAVY